MQQVRRFVVVVLIEGWVSAVVVIVVVVIVVVLGKDGHVARHGFIVTVLTAVL